MGFNQSSSSFSSSSSSFDTKVSKTDLFGAVLAGFGIWTKPSPVAKPTLKLAPTTSSKISSNVYPLRVTRVKDVNPQMAGRMVISGRMADVCAELDRLAA
jgi:hypothetical protein